MLSTTRGCILYLCCIKRESVLSTLPEYRMNRTDLYEPETSCSIWWINSKRTFRVCNLGRWRIILMHMWDIYRQDFLCLILQFDGRHSYIHRNRSQIHRLIKHLGKMSDDSLPGASLHSLVTPGDWLRQLFIFHEIWKLPLKLLFLCDWSILVDVSLRGPSQA